MNLLVAAGSRKRIPASDTVALPAIWPISGDNFQGRSLICRARSLSCAKALTPTRPSKSAAIARAANAQILFIYLLPSRLHSELKLQKRQADFRRYGPDATSPLPC